MTAAGAAAGGTVAGVVAASGEVGLAGASVGGSTVLAGFEKMLKGFWKAVVNADHVLVVFGFSGRSETTAEDSGSAGGGTAPESGAADSHGVDADAGSIARPIGGVVVVLVKAALRPAASAGHDDGAAEGSDGRSVPAADTKRLGEDSLTGAASGAGWGVAAPAPPGGAVAKSESCRTLAVTSEIEPGPPAAGPVRGLPSLGAAGNPAAARSAAERPSVARLSATAAESSVCRAVATLAAASWAARAAAATNAVVVAGQSNRARIASCSPSTQAEGTCATWSRLVRPGRWSTSTLTGSKQAASTASVSAATSTCCSNAVDSGLQAAVKTTSTGRWLAAPAARAVARSACHVWPAHAGTAPSARSAAASVRVVAVRHV